MNRAVYLMVIFLLVLTLVGCSTDRHQADAEPDRIAREVRVIRPQVKEGEATLYIGTAGQYETAAFPYLGEVTPDQLVAAIGELTGWNICLDGPILRDKSGITVTFSEDCALFTGPSEQQEAAFPADNHDALCATLLDSVCHTLQWNIVNPKLADPGLLPVYFRTVSGDLVLEELPFTQPEALPYGGLIPGTHVCSAQGRFLRMTPAGEATFDLDGQEVTMSLYDEDVAYTLSQVTAGAAINIVYLRGEANTILTRVY